MPHFAKLCEQAGRPRMMRSVLPTVSNVAWTCYATGRNPGKHGIYGFIDRDLSSYDLTLPNAADMSGKHIWEILSDAGKTVFGMNVPSSYPPRMVNGVLIGGFLSASLAKATFPPIEAGYLKSIDYRIDSDAALARQSKEKMLGDLDVTLAKRAEAMFHYLGRDRWDFFHTHIMGTDRLNHFLMASYRAGDAKFAPGFLAYYRKVDDLLGKLLEAIGPESPLLILSDHGFCPIEYEVQLSKYMVDRGWTTPAAQVVSPLSFDPAATKAYTLIPGRVYVNLQGREAGGCVPADQYEQVRRDVTKDLLDLRDPQGKSVIRSVLKREEVYWPTGQTCPNAETADPIGPPALVAAPDLVAIPHDGYDLKLGLTAPDVFMKTELEGMHTYHDALLLARNVEIPEGDFEIRRLAGPILKTLGVEVTEEMDMDLEATPAPAGTV